MKRNQKLSLAAILVSGLVIAACGGDGTSVAPAASTDASASGDFQKPQVDSSGASPGKPTAPISMSYKIMNNPVVGAPVQINVDVQSAQGPVNVRYSIIDSSALRFQEGQVEQLQIRDPSRREPRQLAVIPQREGRLYVNVSAEVMTPGGAMIRSMAIPIKVGAAPETPTTNGELKEGPDGETVISMPAEEAPPN